MEGQIIGEISLRISVGFPGEICEATSVTLNEFLKKETPSQTTVEDFLKKSFELRYILGTFDFRHEPLKAFLKGSMDDFLKELTE